MIITLKMEIQIGSYPNYFLLPFSLYLCNKSDCCPHTLLSPQYSNNRNFDCVEFLETLIKKIQLANKLLMGNVVDHDVEDNTDYSNENEDGPCSWGKLLWSSNTGRK